MQAVLYEKKGRIAYVTLNRPQQLNALSPDLLDELAEVWVDFRDDDNLWAAVLAGAGRSFCSGADLKQRQGKSTGARMGPPPGSMRAMSPALRATPAGYEIFKPIVGALHGQVVGGGLWLALGCDVRVAAEDAQLGMIQVRRSIPTPATAFLSDYVPAGIARELLLWGEFMTAQRAYEVGLVNRVVPAGELMATAAAMAERVCENGPLAVRAMKEVLHRKQYADYDRLMTLTEHVFAPVRSSEDVKEGMRSFAEKRRPEWKGR